MPQVQEIHAGDPAPFVRMPDGRTLFSRRATRYRELARESDTLADLLDFLAAMAAAQHRAYGELPELDPAPAERIRLRDHYGQPPLGAEPTAPGLAWRRTLHCIAEELASQALPRPRAVLERLTALDARVLDAWAHALLRGIQGAADPAAVPFLMAALEVYWVRMTESLDPNGLQRLEPPGLCPTCGSPPVVASLRPEPQLFRSRYLHCSLCNTEWHMVRIQCSHCGAMDGIRYEGIEGRFPWASAETCAHCKSYLKIMDMEKMPGADPVADDVATVALDILLGEAGWQRAAIHPLLLPISRQAV